MNIKIKIKQFLARIILRLGKSRAVQSCIVGPLSLNRIIQTNALAQKLNAKAFSQYKGVNSGKDMVLFATGPSLASYKPIDGCIKVGVNHAFLKIPDLDFFFATDYRSLAPVMEQLRKYNEDCRKFLGISWSHLHLWDAAIPESVVLELGAERFVVDYAVNSSSFSSAYTYPFDISVQPLTGGGSVAFVAIQFMLWTNPRRIYLVGCDCSANGHFMSEQLIKNPPSPEYYKSLVEPWKRIKQFADRLYPSTEIISVNPVGLRGLFRDIDQ